MKVRLHHATKDPHIHVARYFSCGLDKIKPFATAIRIFSEPGSAVFATGNSVFQVNLNSKVSYVMCDFYSPCTMRQITAAAADKFKQIENLQRSNKRSYPNINPTEKKGWISKDFSDAHGWKIYDEASQCEFIMGLDGSYIDDLGRNVKYRAGHPVQFPMHLCKPNPSEIAFYRHF